MNNDAPLPLWVQLCGNLAPFASIVGLLSPFPTVRRFQREGKVGNLPLLPYTIMIINCLFYFTYGMLVGEARIWASNGIGLGLGCYYFAAYLPFIVPTSSSSTSNTVDEQGVDVITTGNHNDKTSSTPSRTTSPLPGTLQQHYQAIGLAVGFIGFTMLASRNPAFLIGKVGMAICVSLFASPLAAIRAVLETKSSRSIPLPFTVAMTINCFLWTVFGWRQANDSNVYIPNALGLGFQLVQVGLKLYFADNNILHKVCSYVRQHRREALLVERKSSEHQEISHQDETIQQPLFSTSSRE